MKYPSHCISCGLYQNCSTWNIRGRGIQPADILIVGQGPGRNEDFEGQIFIGPSGQFLQDFLDRLDVSWRLCNATNCYPGKNPDGQGDNKPTKEQVEACSVYLKEEIEQTRPKVIICLGDTAMRAVLGDQAPRTLTAAKNRTFTFEGIKVLVNLHPVNHVTGRQNLLDSYVQMFTYAEKLCLGEVGDDYFKHYMITQSYQYQEGKVGKVIYLDVETAVHKDNPTRRTIFHPDARLLSVSITSWDETSKQYNTFVLAGEALNAALLKRILTGKIVVGHNVKYDLVAIWKLLGFNPYDYIHGVHDTFLAFYLQDQSKFGNGLKNLASRFFFSPDWEAEVWNQVDQKNEQLKALNRIVTQENRKLKKAGKDLLPKHELLADFSDVDLATLCEYNARDTYYTARLHLEVLKEWPTSPAYKLARRMTKALSAIEVTGLPANLNKLKVVQRAVRNKHDQIMATLLKMPEVKAVTDTGHQVGSKVYEPIPYNDKSYLFMESLAARLNYHTGETTASGRLAFGKETLMKLARIDKDNTPVHDRTREQWVYYYVYKARQLKHMSEVFLEKMFLPYVVDGRLRTTYKLGKAEVGFRTAGSDVSGGTETGRLSSANPNLQNLKKDKILRSCFEVPDDDWIIMEFDYDRIEIVVLAELCGDENLRRIVQEEDVHNEAAKKIFKTAEPTKLQRSWAKTMVFAIIYGQLPSTYATKNGVSVEEAEKLYASFFQAYPKIKTYFEGIEQEVRDKGYLVSLWGRYRSFTLYGDYRDWSTLNEAKNTGIQSTATDITSWMLCEIGDELEKNQAKNDAAFPRYPNGAYVTRDDIIPINVVHDSIWFQVRKSKKDEAVAFIKDIMEDMSRLPIEFTTPLKVSYTWGRNLSESM